MLRPCNFKYLKVVLLSITILFFGASSHAATKDEVVTLASEIMQVTLVTQQIGFSSKTDTRDSVLDIVLKRRIEDLGGHLAKLDENALLDKDLFVHFSQLTNPSVDSFQENQNYLALVKNSKVGKWERRYLSYLLLGQAHIDRYDVVKALDYTGQAIEIVNAQEVTPKTASMIYDAYEILQFAYTYDRSTNQAITAIRALKELSIKSGRPLDGYSIVNNLAVLFHYENRNTDAIEIMSVMEPYLVGQPKDKVVLFNYSMAKFKNRAKLYSEAIPHLEEIEREAKGTIFLPLIYTELATSYAYTGVLDEAQKTLRKLEKLPAKDLPKTVLYELSILNVKSQIAELQGDYAKSLRLRNEYSERYIENINTAQFQDRKKAADRIAISQRVATQKLENAARESALKDTIIDREKNINRFIFGLLTLASILVGLLIFGVKRQKSMNVKLAASRDKALASERAKSDFLAMMSHEVRTPLNSIIPVAELLQAKPEYKDDKGLLGLIVAGGHTLLQMLDNILVVSKADNSPPEYAEDLNLITLAQPILKEFGDEARKKGLEFSAKATKGFPLSVHTDKSVIAKVLTNLLSNAVKFTSEGKVSVTFSRAEDEAYYSIKIQDTGIGIETENIQDLLEPFTQKDSGITRGYDGLGIGLSVTNIEVSRLGGRLVFDTDLETGTAVEVILPISAMNSSQGPLEMAA